jgi:4a-hydroxytetrahydrobiopterin dehydratase
MAQQPLNLTELQQQLDELNHNSDQEWSITGGKLHKTFSFKNFIEAFGFMTGAAIHAEKLNHHPEWSNVYRTVAVDLVTHEAGGITEIDFKLAKKMDSLL